MAWGLTADTNTYGLPAYSYELTSNGNPDPSQLQPGDALIAGGHTVIFNGWYDSAHTKYYAIEETPPNTIGGDNTDVIPYPYWSTNGIPDGAVSGSFGDTYWPYRYDNFTAPAPSSSGSHQASEAASQNSGVIDELYEGASGSLQHSWGSVGGSGWVGPASLGGSMASEPSTVTSVSGTVDSFWKGTDGNLWHAYTTGGSWTSPASLGYGTLGSAPYAVAQANGDIDVFWRGTNDDHLWYVQYTAGSGWSHQANDLGGDIATGTVPAPAASTAGTTDVFFKGTDGNLWHVFTSNYGGSWTSPASLGYGVIGQPEATGHGNGAVDVVWRGTNDDHLWLAHYTAGVAWSTQATNLGGDIATGTVPAPVTSADWTTDVLFKGTDGNLWHAYSNNYGANWSSTVSLGMGTINQPYVAGNANGAVDVFWRGAADTHVWHAWYTTSGGWTTTPANLGGNAI
jgi:hypothetical protein